MNTELELSANVNPPKPKYTLVFVLVALFVVVNCIGFPLLSGGRYYSINTPINNVQPISVTPLNTNETLMVTGDNRLIVLKDGHQTLQTQLNMTINSVSVSPATNTVFVGTGTGQVLIYDENLAKLGSFTVQGNVTSVQATPTGDVDVAYGVGQYSNLYWVGQYSATGVKKFTNHVGYTIKSLAVTKDGVYFGTANSEAGLIGPTGKTVWEVTLSNPVTSLLVASPNELVVGDASGNVSLLGDGGRTIWQHALSQYSISALAFSSVANAIIVGDQGGNVSLLSLQGDVVSQSNVPSNSFVPNAFVSREGNVVLFTNAGNEVSLNVGSALQSRLHTIESLIFGLVDLLLLLSVAWTVIRKVPRLNMAVREFGRRVVKSKTAYALIWPSVLLIIVFSLVPVIMAVYYAFTNFDLQDPLQFVGLQNFQQMWSDLFFTMGIMNMMIFLVTSVLKELIFPLLVAELVFWLSNEKLKYWFRTAFVWPNIVPGIVGILLWKMIYDPESGLINAFLKLIGLGQWQHAWLGDSHTALWSIVFAGFPFVDIFGFLVYLGGLIGISRDIYEAAEVDGIGRWRRFFTIDLPLIRPQIRLVMFFTIVGSIQNFTNVYIFTGGGPGVATYVPGLEMYNQISAGKFGYSSAIGLILAVMVLVFTFFNSRLAKDKEA